MLFEYTFGGEKIRKLQSSPVARERIYLGGAEFVNDTLELYHHAEGRVVWRDTTPAFQYRIADHLGNTVVFFEDRDGDTKIKTEPMTSDPDSLEVLQRNYYYPFGMEMEGPWQAVTAPRADYLYNGKELEEDLGLNWYAYGFRYYDPSIGRFTGVDPLAVEYAAWSPYCYALDNPILYIDPDGRSAEDFILINSEGNQIARIPCLGEDRYINIDPLPVVEVKASKDDGKQRGGIELMTGTDKFGGRGGPDPEGTSDAIIDEILIPAGGGASEPFGAPNVFQTFGAFFNKIFGGGASADQEDNGENNEASSTSPSIYKIPTFDIPEKSHHGDTIHVPELEILNNGNGDTLYGTRVMRFDTTGRKSKSQTGTWKLSERIND